MKSICIYTLASASNTFRLVRRKQESNIYFNVIFQLQVNDLIKQIFRLKFFVIRVTRTSEMQFVKT